MANEMSDRELLARIDERTGKLTVEMGELRQEISGIRENGNRMGRDMAAMRTDLDWIKKFFWIVVIGVIATVVKVWIPVG